MKDLKYNSSNNVILRFNKESLYGRFSSLLFREKNISVGCDSPKYESALILCKIKNKDSWVLKISWKEVKMEAKEESFSVWVSYSGKIKLFEKIKIQYPQKTISANDYTFALSKETAIWGTEGEICSLIITPKDEYEPWMFKDPRFQISFKLIGNKGFTTLDSNNSFSSNISGCQIPLKYVGYDKPISVNTQKLVQFYFNEINSCIAFYFTFTPRPYSYKANILALKKQYQYGSENRNLCQIKLERTDNLSPEAKNIEIGTLIPKDFDNLFEISPVKGIDWTWNLFINKKVSYTTLAGGASASVTFNIDDKGSTCKAFFSLEEVLPGVKPHITVTPSNKANAYQGEKCECFLFVKNNCSADINVTDIIFESVPDSLLKIKGEKHQRLSPFSSVKYIIVIDTSTNITTKVHIIVKTEETDDVSLDYDVVIIKRPNALITVDYDNDKKIVNQNLIIGQTYHENDCCSICKIGYSDDSSKECYPIDLSKINFGSSFRLSNDDIQNPEIPFGENRMVRLLFNIERTITRNEAKEKDNNFILPCSWNYFDQSGICNFPIELPKLYRKKCSYFNERIEFPRPNNDRIIPLMELEFKDLSDIDKNIVWDSNQYLLTKSPFSFSKDEITQKMMIKPGDKIVFYLHVDEIVDIDKNTINIDHEIKLDFSPSIQADNHPVELLSIINGEKKKILPKSIVIYPIVAKPKLRILYRTNKEDIRLHMNTVTNIPLEIQSQGEDIEALFVGKLVIQNLESIPYLDGGVKLKVKAFSITVNNQDILHKRTKDETPSLVFILNGDDEVCFPLYFDFHRWKEASLNANPILKLELSPLEDTKLNGNGYHLPSVHYNAVLDINYQYFNDVYSLDLGTTGIVVARESEDKPKCVILEDPSKNRIEVDKEILSSYTMILYKNNEGSLILAPEANVYYEQNRNYFRLVPSKFIVGQEKIPFLSQFYDNENLVKIVKLFNLDDEKLDLELTNKIDNERTISKLIASLYREIFSRCKKEIKSIKKLVITYPNTYTIENLEEIKEILMHELNLNLKGQISFVPESDAVAAYYFNQKIIFNHGFLDKNNKVREEENVIFYDMGAGTLDLSLVRFKSEENEGIVATIINKIGIPLAGNYLDYIIFNTLIEEGWVQSEMREKYNAVKEITSDIKKNYSNVKTIGEINPTWLLEHQKLINELDKLKKKKYQDLFEKSISDFLIACSSTALGCLIPDGITVHTIVFSGRGSQFVPLKQKVLEVLNKKYKEGVTEDKLRPIDNCGDYMKTCVALGAIKYQSYFNNKGPFKIENKNLYSKIAVIYWGKLQDNTYDVIVCNLIDPINDNWDEVEIINGTQCREFNAKEIITNHIPGQIMYYVQTCINTDKLKELFRKVYQNDSTSKDDLNWAFVNLLFKKRVQNSDPITIKLKISKENKIVEREIGGDILTSSKLLENVEKNTIYRKSMWPLITTLK